MFGYVVANSASLSSELQDIYRGYYCGLCRCISKNYGQMSRFTLTYDMTFLVLILSSLYEFPEEIAQTRCMIHPLKKHLEITTEATAYAAAMNVALAYHNCLDNWHDDRRMKALLLSKLLQNCMSSVDVKYERKTNIITNALASLSDIEAQNLQDPDTASQLFGTLLGEIFAWREDRWSPLLRNMGDMLGRTIYLMDAALDLPLDRQKGRYNPLTSRWSHDWTPEQYAPIFKMLLGECADTFERLPLVRHADLLRNILYDGIWSRFCQRSPLTFKENKYV